MQSSFDLSSESVGNFKTENTVTGSVSTILSASSEKTNQNSKSQQNQASLKNQDPTKTKPGTPKHFQPVQIKYLKDQDLHLNLQNLIPFERKVTHQILLHIMEVDRRKLHLDKAYSSLWDYLVNGLGYSPASAQRRIEAARLMVQVPDLGKKLEEGKVNFSQVTQLQKTLRDVKKQTDTQVTAEQKQELIQKLENKSKKETDAIIAEAFQITPEIKETHTTQKNKSLRVEITFTEQEAQMLEWAQFQLSHSLLKKSESFDIKGLMLYCVKRVIKLKAGYEA